MEPQILLAVFIIALLGYIVFLHILLSKKNIFIESTVRRLSGIEKSRSMDEMMAFLNEIQQLSQYSSFFKNKLLDNSTLDFILDNEQDTKTFMHYTKYQADAESIIKNGFRFTDSFYKTALPVLQDKLDLVIKHNNRRSFGEYIIIICISNDIINFYSMELEKAGIQYHSFENILTVTPPFGSTGSDQYYQLVPQFIKGYINYRTGEIVKNPAFDPWYNSPQFMKNIDLLKNR
jgi:hypothetical protein